MPLTQTVRRHLAQRKELMKIYRPKKEPEGVVIDFEDGTMPAYIPVCANYAFKAIKKAAQQGAQADWACPSCGCHLSGPATLDPQTIVCVLCGKPRH